jgi:hypothetical protein
MFFSGFSKDPRRRAKRHSHTWLRLTAVGFALMLSLGYAARSEGAAITFVATADGEVSDQESLDGSLIKDGIFETVNANSDFLDVRFNQIEFTTHGVFEFDLSALPANATITGASFIFRIFATGFQPAIIDFFGGQGDGQITLGDATANVSTLGSITLPVGLPALDNDHVVDLSTAALNNLLASSSLLMVRAQMNPQSGSSITTFVPTEFGPGHIALPSLRLEYDTPGSSPAPVPEPGTLLLLATGALPLARRLSRSRRA